ncbi:MAG TPA: FkbM family methyltransferase [Burkholderiales bacterium]|jgi:FkbM family methyltransferase|nr:FkbM family methyltransferase [Burkholderiales bacterium]
MLRKGGKTEKRLKKLLHRVHRPQWAQVAGIELPLKHPLITPPIQRDIYFGDYERKELDVIERRLEPGDRVMEVGAGIGFLSAYCARVLGDDRVFAYEANPALLELVSAVHARNKVHPQVTQALLGEGDGERDFFVEPDYWASSLVRRSPNAKCVRIRQIDFNSELRRVAPSFLIVDVEGGEYELLRSADLSAVSKLCLEVHPDVLGNARVSQVFARLIAAGLALDFTLMRKNVFYFYRAGNRS